MKCRDICGPRTQIKNLEYLSENCILAPVPHPNPPFFLHGVFLHKQNWSRPSCLLLWRHEKELFGLCGADSSIAQSMPVSSWRRFLDLELDTRHRLLYNHLFSESTLASASTSMPANASPLASKRPPDKGVSFGQSPKRKLDELMFVPEKDQSKDIRDALFRYYAQPRTHCWPARTPPAVAAGSCRALASPCTGSRAHSAHAL